MNQKIRTRLIVAAASVLGSLVLGPTGTALAQLLVAGAITAVGLGSRRGKHRM